MTLADRIEALTGPDRRYFILAWEAIHGTHPSNEWRRFDQLLLVEAWEQAAMMLVPVGWDWRVDSSRPAMAIVYRNVSDAHTVYAATPALALCAAALRAKEASNG